MGVVDPTQETRGLDAFLAEREGIRGLAFAPGLSDGTAAALAARGLHPSPPSDLSRQLELPEGTVLPRFRLFFLPPEETPGLDAFFCQHLTPELVRRPAWLAAERDIASLAAPNYERLQPLVRIWREQRGALPEALPQTLQSLDLLHRSVLVRQRRRSSRMTVEHFGAGIKMLKPCEGMLSVGRDLNELPDGAYGDWVADSYSRALAGRRIRLDGVRATLKSSQATTLRVRYDRLLMPWRAAGGDELVLSVSMRRELSTVA